MFFGNSRVISELMIFASSRNGRTVASYGAGKPPPISTQVHLRVAAVPCFLEHVRREVQRLHVVLEVRRLAPDVEADSLDDEPPPVGLEDQVHRLAGERAELRRQFDHRPGVRHLEAQRKARMRRVLPDLLDLLEVVEGDERLVLVEFRERLDGLDRVGVDDAVPDPLLPLARRHVLDVLVDELELGHRRHVETRALVEERADDRRDRTPP